MSSALDSLSNKVHAELSEVAQKHPAFETFLQDMQRLAEKVWHNARAQAEQDVSDAAKEAVGDAETAVTGTPAAAPTSTDTTAEAPASDAPSTEQAAS